MRLSHFEYIRQVTEAYKKKREGGRLSLLLARSTPANIRKECVNVFKERYTKKDEEILRSFFGPEESGRKFPQIIRNFETSKFKPLDNYLKKLEGRTEDKNIDLLAWLINFEPRPYIYGVETDTDEVINEVPPQPQTLIEISPATDTISPMTGGDPGTMGNTFEAVKDPAAVVMDSAVTVPEGKPKNHRNKKVAAFLFILLTCGGGMYLFTRPKPLLQSAFNGGAKGCMYWSGTHYETTSCEAKQSGRLLLPFDLEKMEHFKRIEREDTISEKSIGQVYYYKKEGKIEYYTSGGNHPVELNKTLKKLSQYMYSKYLEKDSALQSKLIQH